MRGRSLIVTSFGTRGHTICVLKIVSACSCVDVRNTGSTRITGWFIAVFARKCLDAYCGIIYRNVFGAALDKLVTQKVAAQKAVSEFRVFTSFLNERQVFLTMAVA